MRLRLDFVMSTSPKRGSITAAARMAKAAWLDASLSASPVRRCLSLPL
jgi:hypothetical protein